MGLPRQSKNSMTARQNREQFGFWNSKLDDVRHAPICGINLDIAPLLRWADAVEKGLVILGEQ